MANIQNNKVEIAKNFSPDSGVNFTQFTIQVPVVDYTDKRVFNPADSTVIAVALGVAFANTFYTATRPVFTLDGISLTAVPKNNISEIAPNTGEAQFVVATDPLQLGLSSIVYLHISALGKAFSATVFGAQSVLNAWESNEIATKINALDPPVINGKLSVITPAIAPQTGYNGVFTNVQNKFDSIDLAITEANNLWSSVFSAAGSPSTGFDANVNNLAIRGDITAQGDLSLTGNTVIAGTLSVGGLPIIGTKDFIETLPDSPPFTNIKVMRSPQTGRVHAVMLLTETSSVSVNQNSQHSRLPISLPVTFTVLDYGLQVVGTQTAFAVTSSAVPATDLQIIYSNMYNTAQNIQGVKTWITLIGITAP